MPNVSGSAALDVLIGLFLIYFLLSIVCSAINEAIAAGFNLRARDLERGIRNLVEDPAHVEGFYATARVKALFKPAGRIFGERAPSYIPSRVFAMTLLDTFAPPAKDAESHDLVKRAKDKLEAGASSPGLPLNNTVRTLFEDALAEAGRDRDRFRAALERSFDEVMDRASGWYKRRVQLILFVIALGLVGAINADSFALGQRLWKDDALRAAVVSKATATANANKPTCTEKPNATNPGKVAAECVDQIEELGIPLGWTQATSPHSGWDGLGKVTGLLVTAFALSLGAPFWFDLLGKVARLRGSGPPASGSDKTGGDKGGRSSSAPAQG